MHILVIRFSAMGDVALTAPVIHSLLENNQDLKITLVSNEFFRPFFNESDRFSFHPAEVRSTHKGLAGLKALYNELKPIGFDAVVDIHDVLRSRVICSFFKLGGTKVIRFNKGRNEKKALLKEGCDFKKLPHTTERYFSAFEKLGLAIGFSENPWKKTLPLENLQFFLTAQGIKPGSVTIGIAPFAKHDSKIWGIQNIEALIIEIHRVFDAEILLFGGGEEETQKLAALNRKYPNTIVVAGNLDLSSELQLMSTLNVMISMDSSNMHLMCILGKKVVSIWGGTHHYLGFGPLENEDLIVEVSRNNMPCRPSTIYGKTDNNKQLTCAKNAMNGITIEMVINKLNKAIL
jgi:ADP-heptose:LPS heptosyltransferase